MRPRSSRRLYGVAAAKIAAVGAIIMLASLASLPASARDRGSSDSDWERLDRVLVIPRVYKPAAKGDTPAANEPSADDGCGNSSLGAGPGGTIVVAGTADCQSTNTPQSQAQEQNSGSAIAPDPSQAAAGTPAQSAAPSAEQANSGSSDVQTGEQVGTIDEYQRQREAEAEAAAAMRANRIPPSAVVGPPPVPYYLARRYAAPAAPPMAHIYVPTTDFPRAPLPAWMPRPAAPMVPAAPAWMPQAGVPTVAIRPPMFIPPTVGGFGVTRGFAGAGGWRGR